MWMWMCVCVLSRIGFSQGVRVPGVFVGWESKYIIFGSAREKKRGEADKKGKIQFYPQNERFIKSESARCKCCKKRRVYIILDVTHGRPGSRVG